MRPKIILVLVPLLFAFSCKKDSNNAALLGKWRSAETYYSPDVVAMYMLENAPGDLYVQFSWPGSVQSDFFTGCTAYSVKGNQLTLKFTGNPNLTRATYTYAFVNDTLKLYPDSVCSGCSIPFVKE